MVEQWGCLDLNDKLVSRLGRVVQEGPFAGAVLGPMAMSEHLGPYLLGVYESELDRAWSVVMEGAYPQILDIGAKFGYYAVGLARRFPAANVIAFDTDWWARRAVREMANANRVMNVQVRGFCDSSWLRRNLRAGAFLLSDCEGYEGELLAAEDVPHLRTATLIVETHEELVPGVKGRIMERLRGSHAVHAVDSGADRRASSRELGFISEKERRLANQEVRNPQTWLLCLPQDGPNASLQARAAALFHPAPARSTRGEREA